MDGRGGRRGGGGGRGERGGDCVEYGFCREPVEQWRGREDKPRHNLM